MKRSGISIIELAIAVSIFLIGVLALAAALTFDLKAVTRSREAINTDQALVNEINLYVLERVLSNDVLPSGPNVTLESQGQEMLINGKSVKFSLYKYQRQERESIVYNVIQREE